MEALKEKIANFINGKEVPDNTFIDLFIHYYIFAKVKKYEYSKKEPPK